MKSTNIEQTKRIIQSLLGSVPIASFNLGEEAVFGLERYVCSEVKGSVPPLPTLIVAVQFSGAHIKTHSSAGEQILSTTSTITIFPAGVETAFAMLGDVEFALLEIDPTTSPLAEQLYQMATTLVSVVMNGDPVLDVLVRQLLMIAQQQNKADQAYVDAIYGTILLHTKRILLKQNTHSFQSNSLQLNRVRKSVEYIHTHLSEDLSVSKLANALAVSESYFRKIFNDVMGQTVHQFILNTRLNRARELLIHSSFSISQVATTLGFSSQSHLTTQFSKLYRVSPAQYRKKVKY